MTNLSNIKPKKNRESKHTNKQSINHQEWVMLMKKESIQEKPNNHTWRWYSPTSWARASPSPPPLFPFLFLSFSAGQPLLLPALGNPHQSYVPSCRHHQPSFRVVRSINQIKTISPQRMLLFGGSTKMFMFMMGS